MVIDKEKRTWIFRILLLSSICVIIGGIAWGMYLFSNRIVTIRIPSPVEEQTRSFFLLYQWIFIGVGFFVLAFIVNALLAKADVLTDKWNVLLANFNKTGAKRASIKASTDNPEDLIAEINRLHATSMQAIEKKDFGAAERTLLTEGRQYEKVQACFVKMNLAAPAERAMRKKKEIGDLLYIVKDAQFASEYILLQGRFDIVKKDGNFQKMGDVLGEMSALLGSRVQLAKDHDKGPDQEKYARLLADVNAQADYARLYLTFLKVERRYNEVVPMIPGGQYKESMVALQAILTGALKGLEADMAKLKAKSPEIQKLSAQVRRLHEEIAALIAKIQGAYEQMLESSTPVKIGAEAFHSGLTAPTIANSEASKDLTQALAEVERHFKDWDDNARTKDGKV